jgi:hypothetical protein
MPRIVTYVHRYRRPPRKRKPQAPLPGPAIVTAALPKRKRIAGQIVRPSPTQIVFVDTPRQRRWRRMVESDRRAPDPVDDAPKVSELVQAMQERLRQD